MSARIVLIMALSAVFGLTNAQQNINVRGRIIDLKGSPVSGVVAKLSVANLSSTTGNDGVFSITPSNTSHDFFASPAHVSFVLHEGVLRVAATGHQTVSVDVFKLNGALVFSRRTSVEQAGVASFDLSSVKAGPKGIYLLRIRAGGNAVIAKVNSFNMNLADPKQGKELLGLMKKLTAAVDTVTFTKTGLRTKIYWLGTYDVDMGDIKLVPDTVCDTTQTATPVAKGNDLALTSLQIIPCPPTPNQKAELDIVVKNNGDSAFDLEEISFGIKKISSRTFWSPIPKACDYNAIYDTMDNRYKTGSVMYNLFDFDYITHSIPVGQEVTVRIPFTPIDTGLYIADVIVNFEFIGGEVDCPNNYLHLFFNVVPGAYDAPPAPPATITDSTLLRAYAVGVWSGSVVCQGHTYAEGFFLCPMGRLRGYSSVDNAFGGVECGTWTVSNSHINVTSTCHNQDGSQDNWTGTFDYSNGTLLWTTSLCPMTMYRAPGAVTDANCTGGSCSEGGTGTISGCQSDMECGRCWYCDNGTCRYGGEGPYGCYRGWQP